MEDLQVPGYKIERLIAEGGMASVYLAVQETLGRRVALKVLKKFDDPGQSERFLNEGRIVASLNHRNIITIYDVGVTGGRPYLSMEYLEGGDLESRIAEGMSPDEALDLVEIVADCLELIHRNGIVHRDIKPANILFHGDGTPILTDFGIAKEVDKDTRLTRDGAALGSPCYLSPEQAECKPLDGRTDIYGLGIIFYEMLTGRKPFQAESYIETIVAHLTEPPPILPPELRRYQDLLDRMIARDREERFATAGELLEYVEDLRLSEPEPGYALRALDRLRRMVDARPLSRAATRVTEGMGRGLRKVVGLFPADQRLRLALGGLVVALLASAVLLPDREEAREPEPGESTERAEPKTAATTEEAETREPVSAQRTYLELPAPEPAAPPPPPEPEQAGIETESPAPSPPSPAPTDSPEQAPADLVAPVITEHLRLARQALGEYRLIVPEKDSAYYHYQQVLQRDPGNVEALQGNTQIANRYADLVERELDRYDYPKAKRYLQRGLAIQPDNQRLLALRVETDALKNSPKRLIGKLKSLFE